MFCPCCASYIEQISDFHQSGDTTYYGYNCKRCGAFSQITIRERRVS